MLLSWRALWLIACFTLGASEILLCPCTGGSHGWRHYGFELSTRPSHSCECNISSMPWGNFFKTRTNVHFDSRMNLLEYESGQTNNLTVWCRQACRHHGLKDGFDFWFPLIFHWHWSNRSSQRETVWGWWRRVERGHTMHHSLRVYFIPVLHYNSFGWFTNLKAFM